MTHDEHTKYMIRCIELAQQGFGNVHPNPMVGCVIVRNNKIVSEGYHREYGGPHAEINALKVAGSKAKGSTVYVNLEPCAHYGKTPPCVDALIEAGVAEVVIAVKDPNPLVRGRGIKKLKAAGISVTVGILEEEARLLNKKFFYAMEKGRPYVAVKVAQTLDGRMVDAFGQSQWITSEESRAEGHRIRSIYDAVMVGAHTVVTDNPELTVRFVHGRNPVRIVLDGKLTSPLGAKVFITKNARTILITSIPAMEKNRKKVVELEKKGVEVYGIGESAKIEISGLLKVLSRLGITSLMIEGGTSVISQFFSEGYIQKLYCFVAPTLLGGGVSFTLPKPMRLSKPRRLEFNKVQTIGSDIYIEAKVI